MGQGLYQSPSHLRRDHDHAFDSNPACVVFGWATGVLRTMIGSALYLVRLSTLGMMAGIARLCSGSQMCRFLIDWLSRNPDCAINAGTTGASYGSYGNPDVTTGLGALEGGTDAMSLAIDCVDPDPTSNADPSRPRPNDNNNTHHIVAQGDRRAELNRFHAGSLGFNVSDPANTVVLPANRGSTNDSGATVHSTMHTDDYYDYVEERVLSQTDYEGVKREVEMIGRRLLDGDDIWYPDRPH